MTVSALSASVVLLASAASAPAGTLSSNISPATSPEDLALDKLAKLSSSPSQLKLADNTDTSLIGKSMQSSDSKGKGEGPFAKKAKTVDGGATCYVNTVSSSETQATSLTCKPGEQPNRNYTECIPCEAGYKSVGGQTMCTSCPRGTVSVKDANGLYTACKECGENEIATTNAAGEPVCQECGTYEYRESQNILVTIPTYPNISKKQCIACTGKMYYEKYCMSKDSDGNCKDTEAEKKTIGGSCHTCMNGTVFGFADGTEEKTAIGSATNIYSNRGSKTVDLSKLDYSRTKCYSCGPERTAIFYYRTGTTGSAAAVEDGLRCYKFVCGEGKYKAGLTAESSEDDPGWGYCTDCPKGTASGWRYGYNDYKVPTVDADRKVRDNWDAKHQNQCISCSSEFGSNAAPNGSWSLMDSKYVADSVYNYDGDERARYIYAPGDMAGSPSMGSTDRKAINIDGYTNSSYYKNIGNTEAMTMVGVPQSHCIECPKWAPPKNVGKLDSLTFCQMDTNIMSYSSCSTNRRWRLMMSTAKKSWTDPDGTTHTNEIERYSTITNKNCGTLTPLYRIISCNTDSNGNAGDGSVMGGYVSDPKLLGNTSWIGKNVILCGKANISGYVDVNPATPNIFTQGSIQGTSTSSTKTIIGADSTVANGDGNISICQIDANGNSISYSKGFTASKTVSSTCIPSIVAKSSLSFKTDTTEGAAISIIGASNVSIQGGSFYASNGNSISISPSSSKLTITGGSFNTYYDSSAAGNIYIQGGSISGGKVYGSLNSIILKNTANVLSGVLIGGTFSGGTINGGTVLDSQVSGGTITGGNIQRIKMTSGSVSNGNLSAPVGEPLGLFTLSGGSVQGGDIQASKNYKVEISGGTVKNGTLIASNSNISISGGTINGGTFSGISVSGGTINDGTFSPADASASISVSGNPTINKGSFTPPAGKKITIFGNASITGGLFTQASVSGNASITGSTDQYCNTFIGASCPTGSPISSSTDTTSVLKSCPAGFTLSSGSCVKSTTGNAKAICSSGYTLSGSICEKTLYENRSDDGCSSSETYSSTTTSSWLRGQCVSTADSECDSGDSKSGNTCTHRYPCTKTRTVPCTKTRTVSCTESYSCYKEKTCSGRKQVCETCKTCKTCKGVDYSTSGRTEYEYECDCTTSKCNCTDEWYTYDCGYTGTCTRNATCDEEYTTTCDEDYTTTCSNTYDASCPSGYSFEGSTCVSRREAPFPCSSGYTAVSIYQCSKVLTATPTYSCAYGTLSGTTCTTKTTVSPTIYCPAGYELNSAQTICSRKKVECCSAESSLIVNGGTITGGTINGDDIIISGGTITGGKVKSYSRISGGTFAGTIGGGNIPSNSCSSCCESHETCSTCSGTRKTGSHRSCSTVTEYCDDSSRGDYMGGTTCSHQSCSTVDDYEDYDYECNCRDVCDRSDSDYCSGGLRYGTLTGGSVTKDGSISCTTVSSGQVSGSKGSCSTPCSVSCC